MKYPETLTELWGPIMMLNTLEQGIVYVSGRLDLLHLMVIDSSRAQERIFNGKIKPTAFCKERC